MRMRMTMTMPLKTVVLSCLCSVLVFSCNQEQTEQNAASSSIEAPLASVNTLDIYPQDVNVASDKLFARLQSKNVDAEKIKALSLKSLVRMAVFADAAAQDLDQTELGLIEAEVRYFKRELLMRRHIEKQIKTTAPTEVDIRDFYQNNLARFGQKTIKKILVLTPKNIPSTDQLPMVMASLNQWKDKANWRKRGGEFELVETTDDAANLHSNLKAATKALNEGDTSKVFFVDKKPHLLRVEQSLQQHAKPLAEVRSLIRQSLAAKILNAEIKRISEELLAKADVKYF